MGWAGCLWAGPPPCAGSRCESRWHDTDQRQRAGATSSASDADGRVTGGDGGRPALPAGVSPAEGDVPDYAAAMRSAWDADPARRPTAQALHRSLQALRPGSPARGPGY